ncbi:PQ loop repeat-domain-containing protein [Xylaria intraflava]|nr:PQ loop repeat-domain-containing protein [Xylaria intraflava]
MAPQGQIPIAANVLGTIGTILWSLQLVPQAWSNWRRKDTEGLPSIMMFLWAACGVPFGIYAIVQNFNIPVQVQPQIFMFLCLVNWGQILLYTHKWPLWRVFTAIIGTGAIFAGIEAALILTIRPIYAKGNETPVVVIGVASAILLAAGLIPPYGEAWKRRGRIKGINFFFLTLDSLGAFFSLLSLVVQQTFDILGGVMYIVVILLEIGIFITHLIWLFRTREIRKQAKLDGKTFDDILTEHEQRKIRFKFAERKSTWPGRKSKADEEALESAFISDPTAEGNRAMQHDENDQRKSKTGLDAKDDE